MRSWLVKTHRYLALTVGIFFVFLGLTGSILAFYPELDRLLNPNLNIRSSGKIQSLDLVLNNAKSLFPDKFLHSVFLASDSASFHQVWFTPSDKDSSLMWEVMVDPATAEVIGHRQAVPVYEFTRENLVNTIYTLHLLIFFGSLSYIFLGICGVFLLMTLIIGVWLWWPTQKTLLLSLSVKKGASSFRRAFDLHRVFGVYGFAVIFIIGISGTYLALPEQVQSILGVQDERPRITVSASAGKGENQDLGSLLSHASSLVDERLKMKSVWMPRGSSNFWRFTYIDPTNIGYAGSEVILMLDAQSGILARSMSYETDSGIQRVLRWQLPLHSGKAFGFLGRTAVFCSGFVPLVLFISGVIIWRRKRAVLRHNLTSNLP